jgi:hypothetical protein
MSPHCSSGVIMNLLAIKKVKDSHTCTSLKETPHFTAFYQWPTNLHHVSQKVLDTLISFNTRRPNLSRRKNKAIARRRSTQLGSKRVLDLRNVICIVDTITRGRVYGGTDRTSLERFAVWSFECCSESLLELSVFGLVGSRRGARVAVC